MQAQLVLRVYIKGLEVGDKCLLVDDTKLRREAWEWQI
jgi:hypothetical protein